MNGPSRVSLLRRIRARWIRLCSGTRIRVRGEGHCLAIDEARLFGVRIEIVGHGNELIIGPNTRIWGSGIRLNGDNLRCVIGDHCRLRQADLIVEDRSSRLVVGSHTSGTRCTLLAGEGGFVEIGEDCMISAGADIRNTDGHSVLELDTGWRLNPARDIRLADHVWIGLRAQVLKGTRLGEHSIAAAGCVVVKDVPPNTIVAGIPAQPIRSGITWRRERLSMDADIRMANV